jgi:hypothetical protein
MRYSEIMHTKHETAEQREWRLGSIYGAGPTDGEWENEEMEELKAKNELARSKVRQGDADALAKFAKLRDTYDPMDLDRDFPWPSPGNRSMTADEKRALWMRASLVCGRPLPPFAGQ